ncbi:MAG: type I methionyl aminopeptidase [Phoenicibacter congonensis]|uniref:Methionine aminopeptidase n=1 Tax=Phoenicibacter congonensis TaxID=1944646 RepID=A0AA43U5L7_9ACTN|nr:type I methionyl aminopeptidase [Phoenicibacter congonensis]
MYDNFGDYGRNDACWCGSGKKYKKCHADFDEKLEELWLDGECVPPRSLIKTAADIEGIKESAKVNIGALDLVAANIKPGCTTEDIDNWVHDYTFDNGAIPAPLNYEGFPKSCCTSVNDVVCHGIPSKDEVLKEGDIVNVDCSTIKDGYFSDSSRMFIIGEGTKEVQKFVETVRKSINVGLTQVKPWFRLHDMARELQRYVEDQGYSVVREYGGHGIGLEFHEDPWVSHTVFAGEDMIMPPGMCFTIEPMVNMGKHKITDNAADGWTVRTKDHSLSAQWEIQLVVTETGYEILTW